MVEKMKACATALLTYLPQPENLVPIAGKRGLIGEHKKALFWRVTP